MNIHLDRSKLVNNYKTQIRAIEKQLRKKRIPEKEREILVAELAAIEQEQEAKLADFDETSGLEHKPTKCLDTCNDTTDDLLVARNWGSLSKSDLVEQCGLRGLSKKGTKEDLISRLQIWNSERAGTLQDIPKVDESIVIDMPQPPAARASKDAFRIHSKKLWKSSRIKSEGRAENYEGSLAKDNSSSDLEATAAAGAHADEDTRIERRRDVTNSILVKVLMKQPKGIELDAIASAFAGANVINFTPELLGYESLQEWAAGLPSSIAHYDETSAMLYHITSKYIPKYAESSDEDADSQECV